MSCKECGSPTKHKSTCSKSTPPAPPKVAPKVVKPLTVPKLAPASDGFDPAMLTDDQLAACVHEAGARAECLRARAQRLEEMVAEAAPRPAERAA